MPYHQTCHPLPKIACLLHYNHRATLCISDSAANIFDDEETVWACGFTDGQKVGYMYLGEAEADLTDAAKAGGLRARCEARIG